MVKKNFTRKSLSNKINKILGFSKNLSANLIDDFFDILIKELTKTNKVKISSFGTFKIRNKKARIGRNPKTKIGTQIAPRKVVTFKPSHLLKEKINTK